MSKKEVISTIALYTLSLCAIAGITTPLKVEAHTDTITVRDEVSEPKETIVVPIIEEKVVEVEKEVIKSPFPLKRIGEFRLKGYCNCDKCKPNKANPRSIRESEGVNVVADPKIIPEGTMVWVDGVGIRQVQPSSRTTQGENIIVYFDNHDDVIEFGESFKVVYKIMN